MNKDWLASLKKQAEGSDDPAVAVMVDVAEKFSQALDDVREGVMSKEDGEAKIAELNDEFGKLDKRLEQGFDDVSKQIDDIAEENKGVWKSDDVIERSLTEALSYDNKEGMINFYKMSDPNLDPNKPIQFALLVDEWFTKTAQLQVKGYERDRAAISERVLEIEKVLEDCYGKAAYAEGAAGTGGNLTPAPVAGEILRIVQDNGVMIPLVRKLPMTSDTMTIPNEFGNFTVYWGAEAATLTGGENTFGVNTLNANRIHARATASIEVIEDSAPALVPYIRTVMGEQLARELDQEILEGDGTNFTGLNTETSVNSVATTTTDTEDVAYPDFTNAFVAAGESSTRVSAVWVMAAAILGKTIGMVDSNGQPIVRFGMVEGAPSETILGRPIFSTTVIATDTTRGSNGNSSNIYFGPMNKLILGMRQDFRWDVSDAPNWANYQLDMRLVGRFGFTVGTPAAFTKIVGCAST